MSSRQRGPSGPVGPPIVGGVKDYSKVILVNQYAEKQKQMVSMGFDAEAALEALTATKGNVEAACCVLLGEPITVERVPASPVTGAGAGAAAVTVTAASGGVSPLSTTSSAATAGEIDLQQADYNRRIKSDHMKFMGSFKTKRCTNASPSHDKRMCYFWHSRGDRRRSPFDVPYSSAECNCFTTSQGDNSANCPDGDACLRAHNMTERMFHPELFKITLCAHIGVCDRGLYCAFAHSSDDHRNPLPINQLQSEYTELKHANAAASTLAREEDPDKARILQLLIQAGPTGLTSSEVKSKFFDVFGIKLVEDSTSRLKVKEILLSLPGVTVLMIRGSQKYIFDVTKTDTSRWNGRGMNVNSRPPEASYTGIVQRDHNSNSNANGIGNNGNNNGSGNSNGNSGGNSLWGGGEGGMSFLSVDMDNLNMNLLGGSLGGVGGAADGFNSSAVSGGGVEGPGDPNRGGRGGLGVGGFSGYSGFEDASSSQGLLYGGFEGGAGEEDEDYGDLDDLDDLGDQNMTANLGFLGSLVGDGAGATMEGASGGGGDVTGNGGNSETNTGSSSMTGDAFASNDFFSSLKSVDGNQGGLGQGDGQVGNGDRPPALMPAPQTTSAPPLVSSPLPMTQVASAAATSSTRRRGPDSTLIAANDAAASSPAVLGVITTETRGSNLLNTASNLVGVGTGLGSGSIAGVGKSNAFGPPPMGPSTGQTPGLQPMSPQSTTLLLIQQKDEELEKLRAENFKLKTEVKDLKTTLNDSTASYGRTITTLNAKNEKTTAELVSSEAGKATMTRQLKEKDSEIAGLKDNIKKYNDEHHQENNRNEKEKNKLRNKVKDAETDAALTHGANKTLESEISQIKSQIQAYTQQLTSAKVEVERYKTELVRVSGLLKKKTDDSEKREKEFRADIAELRATIDQKSQEFDQSAEALGRIIANSNIADSPEAAQLIENFQTQFGRRASFKGSAATTATSGATASASTTAPAVTPASSNSKDAQDGKQQERDPADMCAMPGCNLEGSFVCGRCSLTRYCGEQHQQAHWKVHKSSCVK